MMITRRYQELSCFFIQELLTYFSMSDFTKHFVTYVYAKSVHIETPR